MTKKVGKQTDEALKKAIAGFRLDDLDLPPEIDEAAFRSGNYPHKEKLKSKTYKRDLRALQIELLKAQTWVKEQGERVVVSPGAIFSSNTVIFETLLTGSMGSDPCNPSTQGAVMTLNAVTGGPSGASSLGGWPIIGARISNARTSGSLPLVSALGGGQAYLPGTTLAPSGTKPLSIDAPIWRRRSWQGIQQN